MNSNSVFQSQWLTGECNGPPTNMYIFNIQDPFTYSSEVYNETWTPLYEYLVSGSPIGYCGGGKKHIASNECCKVSINLKMTEYESTQYDFISNQDDMLRLLPQTTNGGEYCRLQSHDNQTLFGYNEIYIRKGTCANQIKCNDDQFQIYNSEKCQGEVKETIGINNSLTLQHTTIGDISVQSFTISQAKGKISWLALVPIVYFVPRSNRILGIIHLALMALSCLGSFITTIRCILKYRSNPNKMNTSLVVTQAFQLISTVCFMAYVCSYIETDFWVGVFLQITYGFQGLTSLLLVYSSANLLLHLYGTSILHSIITYSFVLIVHLILAGSYYFYFSTTVAVLPYTPFINFVIYNWSPLKTYWIYFQFLFNFIPMFLATKQTLKSKTASFQSQLYQLIQTDSFFCWIMVIYLFNILIYLFSMYIKYSYTYILGSDDLLYIIHSVPSFVTTIHVILQCLFLDHLKDMRGVRMNTKKTMKESSKPATFRLGSIKKPNTEMNSNKRQPGVTQQK